MKFIQFNKLLASLSLVLFPNYLIIAQESPLVGEWIGYYKELWGRGDGTDNTYWKPVKFVIQIRQSGDTYDVRAKKIDEENGKATRYLENMYVKSVSKESIIAETEPYHHSFGKRDNSEGFYRYSFDYNGIYIVVTVQHHYRYSGQSWKVSNSPPFGDNGNTFNGTRLYRKEDNW